jgi:trehalose/maltose hydrolase-like predicted phosphorylase
MGLSSQGYNGHIFGILNFGCTRLLALQPDMAKIFLDYRSDRLQRSKSNRLWLQRSDVWELMT